MSAFSACMSDTNCKLEFLRLNAACIRLYPSKLTPKIEQLLGTLTCLVMKSTARVSLQIVKLGLFNNKLTQGIHLPTKITEEAAKGSSYNCTGTLILTRTAGDVLCSSLKELDLAANNLSEDWMHALLIALRNYPNLLPSLETLVLGVTSHLQNCPVIKYSPGGNENSMSLRENMSDLLSELQLRTGSERKQSASSL
eukprot:765988-Hanusia_phi.AAC.32